MAETAYKTSYVGTKKKRSSKRRQQVATAMRSTGKKKAKKY